MQIQNNDQSERGDLLVNALKGAVAGAVGVWVMDKLDWFNFEHEDAAARAQTERVRPGGLDPVHVAVGKIANALGKELSPAQPNWAGIALHYALGIVPGMLYGAFRNRLPVRAGGQDHLYGAAFGLGLFAAQDEGLNSAMGLSAGPRQYPWQAHARGFASHLVLGLATNAVLNLLKAPRPSPQIPRDHSEPNRRKTLDYLPTLAARGREKRTELH